jgi:equilibrative nucleoside transporter 1/2/3
MDLPVDKYRLVYWVFFLQGIGMLFPWNVFITANEYFKIRFKGSDFGDNFQSYFSIAFMLFNTGFMYFLMVTKYDYKVILMHYPDLVFCW